ncbi:hypothetical protein RclHR1_00540012 [Rhizophagus clarus]|uniref:TPR-like protein n=1 Tax=Rhizophagus clarus TaxID=94130 RepID=A0A2Z6S5D8_9GLOM|nr:hypothetical protein RclHR1_00540012 [Rhizophagus clarus]GES88947.1 hypothetical protein GLOIN_2v1663909 [Rhizophagus clarus]
MSKNKRSYKKLEAYSSLPSQNSKKIRSTPSIHAPTCDDSTCTGCDVSEIEIVFTTEDGQGEIELSPDKLLQLALEESSKESPQEHGNGVAKRLFDMALEKFDNLLEKEEKEMETKEETVKGKEIETRPKVVTKQTRYQYATCCVAFGIYLPSIEQIRKGIEIFKQIIVEDDCYYDAWIGLGRARISLAKVERETTQQSDSSEEEEEEKEEQESSIRTEQNSYNLAIDALDKGLSILRSKDEDKYMSESILVAKDLKEYALSINHSKFTNYTQKILNQAINYFQNCYELDSKKKLDQNNFAQGIWGGCLYYLAKLKTNQDGNDYERESKLLLNSAIEKLSKAYNDSLEKDRFTEILGQAYILKTTIESDEEQIMEAYDKGLECLKEAYEFFPDNENLREQLVTLGAFNSSDENEDLEEEEEEEEED